MCGDSAVVAVFGRPIIISVHFTILRMFSVVRGVTKPRTKGGTGLLMS